MAAEPRTFAGHGAERPGPQHVLGDSVGEKTAVVVIGLAALVLAVSGMVVSFEVVQSEMTASFGRLAFVVPLGVDLSILVFSSADLLQTYWRMNIWWVRLVPAVFTAATITLNVSAGGTVADLIAHAAMPSLWVVFVELVRAVIKKRIKQVKQLPLERIPLARWLLAPWPTWKLWRRMVLWRVTSYDEALRLEAQRRAQRVFLHHRWGAGWRDSAPADEVLAADLLEAAPAALVGPLLAEFASAEFSLVELLRANVHDSGGPHNQPGRRAKRASDAGARVPEPRTAADAARGVSADEQAEGESDGDGDEGSSRRDLPRMRQRAQTVYLAYQSAARALPATRLAELSGFSPKQARRRMADYAEEFGPIEAATEDDDVFAKELAERIADGLVLEPARQTADSTP